MALALLYLAVLLPAVSQSYPSDDTLLVVPALLADLDGGSLGHALTRLLAPDPPYLPRAVWKLYVLMSLWLFGPTNAGLVYVGLALHAICSALVWTLAPRLGLSRRVAWLAASLYLTAYAGSHAYVWPVGVQHVLTILGVLLLVTLYLATDRRWRAGLPYRGCYWLTVLAALLSSLSRASSLIGPVAVLTHALLGPGDAAERLRRYRLWQFPMLASLVYPCALFAYAGDLQAAGTVPVATLLRLLVWHVGADVAFLVGILYALVAVLLGRLVLELGVRAQSKWGGAPAAPPPRPPTGSPRADASTPSRPGWWLAVSRRVGFALGIVAALVAAPWVARPMVVFVWGVEAFLTPLSLALNSWNTARWHMVTFPIDLVGVGLAVALLTVFLRRHVWNRDLVVRLVLFAGFALAVSAAEAHPLRYWIYVTPALAIVLAAGLDAAWLRV